VQAKQAANQPSSAGAEPTGDAKLVSVFDQMSKKRKEGQFQAALDIYDALPDDLKKDKFILIECINNAKHLKGKPYADAIRAYRQAFPNEPNLNLFMMDGYLEHKLYDRALASIDALDQSVGGDTYFDLERAKTYRLKGDRDEAKKCAEKAIKTDPKLEPAYKFLLEISLEEHRFSETARVLTLMQKHLPDRMPAVQTDAAYAGFLKSSSYRAWSGTQKR
jgi:tetratricopeptide (TPR) repeat protein